MFSRSEKTEEVIDPMAEPSGQRSPMVLAALAGLLAIAGAFLLVWYLNNGQDDVANPVGGSDGDVTSAPAEANRQVLVVVETIPRNTSVTELIEAPTVYLSARAVPEQFVAASAITSVAELRELEGLVLGSDALPGEQLLRGRFRDPNDFDSNNETFLEAEAGLDIPPGHHAVAMELPSSRALGGNIGRGDLVTIVVGFRTSPFEGDSFDVSVVALNEVELLFIQSTLEVNGQLSNDLNSTNAANRGSYTIIVAVTPEELTDLTYAQTYGEITLATAVTGLDNSDDSPRAATSMSQTLGDPGVWLNEPDDGNLIDFIPYFRFDSESVEGQSIELDLPSEDDDADNDSGDSNDDSTDVGLEPQDEDTDAAGDS